MYIFANNNDLTNFKIELTFKKINSFDELLKNDVNELVYVEATNKKYWKTDLTALTVVRKKNWFCKTIYFKLNDWKDTKVYRDNFALCGYNFYKLKTKLISDR